ncbi:MAG: hypothetical protein NTV22_16480 [bacterium]|nr:hypothetical protein [bacterium]
MYGLLGVCICGFALVLTLHLSKPQAPRVQHVPLASSAQVIAALQKISISTLMLENATLDEAGTSLLRDIRTHASNAADISLTWSDGSISDIYCNLSDLSVYDALIFLCDGFGSTCLVTYANGVAQIPPDVSDDAFFAAKKVAVRAIDVFFPANTCLWENILWDVYATYQPPNAFDCMTTEQWQSNWVYFASALYDRAYQQKLPCDTLVDCFASVLKSRRENTAILPVCAYFVKAGQRPVWIIFCKWELEKLDGLDGIAFQPLSHICVWALDADTGTVLSFVTCN